MHQATETIVPCCRATLAPTEGVLLQHTSFVHQHGLKRPVFQTNLAEAKSERLFDKVIATATRTAEVTICIIPERTARPLSTFTELLKVKANANGKNKKKKTLRCLLSLDVTHGVCNEVWWRPYPTNLPPPPITTDTSAHMKETPHVPKATLLPWAYGPPYSLSCGGQVPDVGIPHYRDARMQHSQSRQPALPLVTTVVAPRECQHPLTECSLHPQRKM